MSYSDPELAQSRQHAKVLTPKDSATLVLVRRDGAAPRILMGQRGAGHAFMPNKYVFPGGRLDPSDCRVKPAQDVDPATLGKLTTRMRGRPSTARARGIAFAAVRETFEEAGLLYGRGSLEEAPDLSGLVLFMRAITPPGRTRRFDSRFFVADAAHVSNLDQPHNTGSDELLTLRWFTLDEIRALELPSITQTALDRLSPFLASNTLPPPTSPVSFQYWRRNRWVEDEI